MTRRPAPDLRGLLRRLQSTPRVPPAGAVRAKVAQKKGGMNRGEESYSRHLEARKAAGEVLRWDYEPENLRLADNTYYRPDFRVVMRDGEVQMHDVKGRKGEAFFAHEDAWIKVKVASFLHPYRFFVVWPRKVGGWEMREI